LSGQWLYFLLADNREFSDENAIRRNLVDESSGPECQSVALCIGSNVSPSPCANSDLEAAQMLVKVSTMDQPLALGQS